MQYKIRLLPRKKQGTLYESSFYLKNDMKRRLVMKKALIVLLISIAVGLALNVQAASVTFEPPQVKLKIAPGEIGRTSITAHGYSNTAYSLNFLVGSKLKIGNIPRSWLTAAYLWLDSKAEGGVSSRNMDLVVTVPLGTTPGKYSGLVVPDDMQCSEPISSQGVLVAIEVSDS